MACWTSLASSSRCSTIDSMVCWRSQGQPFSLRRISANLRRSSNEGFIVRRV